MKLALSQIRLDGGTQSRAALNEQALADYCDAMGDGEVFPPVVVFHDGQAYWLADGFHRVRAAERACLVEIDADVRQGSQRDAVLFSVGANSKNGVPRSPADKRRAVLRLLEDAEWSAWSDREIARQAAVSHEFVRRERAKSSVNVDRCEPRKVERGGVVYEMNTSAIGARPVASPTAPAPIRESVDTDSRIAKPSQLAPQERARLEAMARGEDTDVEVEETKEEVKPQKIKIGPPCFAMQFARLAVMQLEHIQDDDTEKTQAFEFVKNWVATHEN